MGLKEGYRGHLDATPPPDKSQFQWRRAHDFAHLNYYYLCLLGIRVLKCQCVCFVYVPCRAF